MIKHASTCLMGEYLQAAASWCSLSGPDWLSDSSQSTEMQRCDCAFLLVQGRSVFVTGDISVAQFFLPHQMSVLPRWSQEQLYVSQVLHQRKCESSIHINPSDLLFFFSLAKISRQNIQVAAFFLFGSTNCLQLEEQMSLTAADHYC